jgi:hypothetical protein
MNPLDFIARAIAKPDRAAVRTLIVAQGVEDAISFGPIRNVTVHCSVLHTFSARVKRTSRTALPDSLASSRA